MRRGALLREAWATVIHQPVPATMVALLTCAMCLTTLLTVGRTAGAEEQVLTRLEYAGSRLLIVEDTAGHGLLTPAVVEVAANLDDVERAVGLTMPVDVTSGVTRGGGTPVPAWGVIGDVEAVATLASGRWPRPGEALVVEDDRSALGLDGPVGSVAGSGVDVSVVGTYRPRDPFTDFAGVLYVPEVPPGGAASLHVIALTAEQARGVEELVLGIVAAAKPEDLTVTSPAALAGLQGQIGEDFGAYSRRLLLLVLGAGGLLTVIVVSADVLVRRGDLGRRRALGATRATVTGLVLLRTAYVAVVGALVGSVAGLLLTRAAGTPIPIVFTAATATLAVLTACAATLLPAVVAASRDPVKVLRTP